MLRRTIPSLASKVSGGHAKNQAGRPRRKAKQFNVFINTPVSTKEALKEQRHRYGQNAHSRLPEYRPGQNVRMDRKFTLHATRPGVMTIQKSKINPDVKWLHVDPDIQKHRRANDMRSELIARGDASHMTETNEAYAPELQVFKEPHWRERVMEVLPLTKRYQDPNLFVRGRIGKLDPLKRYTYE